MDELERKDRQFQGYLSESEFYISDEASDRYWEEIKSDRSFLEECIKVVKNRFGENMINGIATVYLLIDRHKEVPEDIMKGLLHNIFTLYCDKKQSRKIFETKITIAGLQQTYLSNILFEIDLIIEEKYQEIIFEYLLLDKQQNYSDDFGFFIRRDDIKEEYKEALIDNLGLERIESIYDDWYTTVANSLINDFGIEDAFLNATDYLGKTYHENEQLNIIMNLNLKFLKRLEQYLFVI